MKKLTDVYIKVTKGNVKELNLLIKKLVKEGDNLLFEGDCIESVYIDNPKNKQKVSLTELKRLIDTIPSREEIKRLKQQISGYKTNLSLTNERCKELQSDNERLVHRSTKLRELNDVIYKDVDRLTKENDNLKELLKAYKEDESVLLDSLRQSNNINIILQEENEQLKNRKFWQIWK